jgi:RNA polymerase sigma factor (sigma-70 family)
MKKERPPTCEEFEMFLAWLDSDSQKAGDKYRIIETRLIQIFVSRGCVDAEALADEVFNRVAVRILEVRGKYSDPLRCCLGFVENVFREYLREEIKKRDAQPPPPPRPPDELEKEDNCLKECMGELPQRERDLVKRYFQGEKRVKISGREKLAAELRLTANALRIQAHRLRRKLRICLKACLEET